MRLKWIGDPRYVVGVGGWPAADHDEPVKKVAKAKVKSGYYVAVDDPEPEALAEVPAKQEESD